MPKAKSIINKLSLSKPLWAVLIFNSVLILIIFLFKNFLPPVVPLFYGFPRGEEQLAPSIALTLPPLISIAVTVVCTLLIAFLKDDFLKKILLTTSVVVTTLSFVTILKIILLVGSL